MYSDLYLKSQSKPPMVLVVVAMIAVLGFFASFTSLPQAPIRANKEKAFNHTVVNPGSREAGIYWETENKTVGWVIWGEAEDSLDSTSIDERDLEANRAPSRYHFVRLKNLKENTAYYYKLVGNDEVIAASGDKAYTFTTLKNFSPIASLDPAYGEIIKPNGDKASNVIVRLTYPGAYPLITLSKIDGAWLTPLPYFIDKTTNQIIAPDENAQVTIEMFLDDVPKTTVHTTLPGAAPVSQTIILGGEYNLQEEQDVIPVATDEARLTPKPQVDILFPREKAIIPAKNPLIKGMAIPGADVSVRINTSPQTSFIVQANKRGEWTISDPVTIAAGNYKLTVSTTDNAGKLLTQIRNFSIAKSGEQVLASATGPGTLTPTVTPTLMPTATTAPLFTPTPQPTYAIATATPAPPISGLNPIHLFGGSALLILVGTGLLLLL